MRRNKLQKKNIRKHSQTSFPYQHVIPTLLLRSKSEVNSINRSDLEGKILKRGKGEVTQLSFHVRSWLIDLRFPGQKNPLLLDWFISLKERISKLIRPIHAILVRSFDRREHVNDYSITKRQYNNMKPYRQDLSLVYYTSKGFVTGYRLISPHAGFLLRSGCSALFDGHVSRPGKKLSGRNNDVSQPM